MRDSASATMVLQDIVSAIVASPVELQRALQVGVELIETVEAPEGLAVDDHEWRAEHAARQRLPGLFAQPFPYRLAFLPARQCVAVEADGRAYAQHFIGLVDGNAID